MKNEELIEMIIQKIIVDKKYPERRTIKEEVRPTQGIEVIHEISRMMLEEHDMNFFQKYNTEIIIKIDYP
jgi:hypothetical protein